MNANETWWFANRADQARRNYGYNKAQNDYERGLARTQAGWDRADLVRQFSRQRQALPANYNRRGVMNSGIWNKALADWTTDKTRALTRQTAAADMKQQGYDLADYQLADIKRKALDDLAAQRTAYEQTIASILRTNYG